MKIVERNDRGVGPHIQPLATLGHGVDIESKGFGEALVEQHRHADVIFADEFF